MKLKNTNKLALWALAISATLTTAHAAIITVTTPSYTYPGSGLGNQDAIVTGVGGNTITVPAGSGLTGNAGVGNVVTIGTAGYTVTNNGSLTSSNAVGVLASVAATITNTGTITGSTNGISVTSGIGTVNNSGSITAAPASASGVVNFGSANDVLTMTAGTITNSTNTAGSFAVNFGTGDDTFNFKAGTINGNVDGGAAGTDALAFNGLSGDIATLNGAVTNFEAITQNGVGLATINGNITSNVTVNSGALYLNGTVVAPITVNGGTLGGTGTWTGTVIQNGGMITAGNAPLAIGNLSISTLTVNGGSLLVNMNAVNQTSDLLTVSGNANISGSATVLVSPTTINAPLQNKPGVQVLHVVGTSTGQYATAASFYLEAGRTDTGPLVATSADGAFTSSTVSLSVARGNPVLFPGQVATDSYVAITHNYDTVVGLNSFGQQFGSALNGQVANSLTNPILADFLGYLDYSSAATVAGVMNAYTPRDFQASLAYSDVSAREIHRIVEQQNLGDSLFPSNNHVWANYNANSYLHSGNSSRYTMGVGGVAVDTFHFGGLLSYANADLSSSSTIETLAYGAYVGMGAPTGWQVNGYIGGSHNKTTTRTTPDAFAGTPLSSELNFNPDGNSFQALLSGAYLMEESFCTWGPTLGVEMVKSTLSGTIAPGAALPNMTYSSDTLRSLRTLLGLRAEFTLGSKVRPYLSAQWAREFDGTSNGYTATFQGASFNVKAPINLATDAIILRGGVVIGLGDSCFADIGYLGEYSTSGDSVDYNGLNVGLRVAF